MIMCGTVAVAWKMLKDTLFALLRHREDIYMLLIG